MATQARRDADLELEALGSRVLPQPLVHLQARSHRQAWLDEGGHHGVADGLDDRSPALGDHRAQHIEVASDHPQRHQITHLVVELRTRLQVGEEERQVENVEAGIGGQRLGAEQLPEALGAEGSRFPERKGRGLSSSSWVSSSGPPASVSSTSSSPSSS